MRFSSYIQNINRIECLVTYHCTGRCLHCSVGDSLGSAPEGRHCLDGQAAAAAIRRLAELFHIRSVMTFGGEPLLYPEAVCAIHGAAKACGIGERQVITNGFFSRNEERIRAVADQLAAAGVNDLLLSVDAFHQRRIPLEPVRRFAASAKEAGLPLRLQPAWLVNRAQVNAWNAETERVLREFADLEIPVGAGNDIFMAGNAARNLAGYYPASALNPSDRCGSMPYTAPLTEVSTLSLEPNGDVSVCGFAIGNILRERVEEILARYDPFADETMRAALSGVPALLRLAEERGIAVDPARCYSICNVCHALCARAKG